MSGYDHYQRAQNVLSNMIRSEQSVAEAQVHATLALVAVVAEAGGLIRSDALGLSPWARAIHGAVRKP